MTVFSFIMKINEEKRDSMDKKRWKELVLLEEQEINDNKYTSFQRKLVVTEKEEKGKYVLQVNRETWTYDEKLMAFLMDEIHDKTVKVMMCDTSDDEENLIEIRLLVEDYVLRFFIFKRNNILFIDVSNTIDSGPLKDNLKGEWTKKIKESIPGIVRKLEKYLKEISSYKLKLVIKEYEIVYTFKLLRILLEKGTEEQIQTYLQCLIETFEFSYRRLKNSGIQTVADLLALNEEQINEISEGDETYANSIKWQQKEIKELIKK